MLWEVDDGQKYSEKVAWAVKPNKRHIQCLLEGPSGLCPLLPMLHSKHKIMEHLQILIEARSFGFTSWPWRRLFWEQKVVIDWLWGSLLNMWPFGLSRKCPVRTLPSSTGFEGQGIVVLYSTNKINYDFFVRWYIPANLIFCEN